MQDLACLIAPRVLTVIAGKKDDIFPIEGVRKGYDTIQRIYEKAGAKYNCSLTETPNGHWWREDIVWEAIKTATKKLGW